MTTGRRRQFYQLYSKIDADWKTHIECDPSWKELYTRTHKCSHCLWPSREWHHNPVPIDIVLKAPLPAGSCLAIAEAFPKMIHNDLLDVLLPHMRGCIVGSCAFRGFGEVRPLTYSTIHTPERYQLEAHRGKDCWHKQCPGCGTIWNNEFRARGGIVERCLDDRLVYQDSSGWLYVDGSLAETLQLRERFPDLRYCKKYPVIKKPLDIDTLPGDPGWTGSFVQKFIPPVREYDFGDESSPPHT